MVFVTVRSVRTNLVEAFSDSAKHNLLAQERYLLVEVGCTAQGDIAQGESNEAALSHLVSFVSGLPRPQ